MDGGLWRKDGMKLKGNIGGLVKVVSLLAFGLVFLAGLVLVIAWMADVFEEKIEAEPIDVRGRKERKATEKEIKGAYVVNKKTKDYIEEAVGTLKAADRTEISTRVLARIQEIRVRAGQVVTDEMVKTGYPLILLDRRDLDTERSQAEASLVAADAAMKRAQSDYRRAVQLRQKGVISQADYEQATENVKVRNAELDHAKQALEGAKVRLSYATLAASKPGVIVDRLAEEGDTARPGEPLLVLYDPKSLRLEVPVMENLAINLKLGEELSVYIDARNREIKAAVDEIVPQAEAASRSFLVKLRLPRSDDLFEGMFGRLRIPVDKREHLCLHVGAIETIGQLQFVEVIGSDGFKQRRFIKTGRMGDPNHVEVISGLKEGELVVMKDER